MKTLEAHGRIAALTDSGFEDWQLGIGDRLERMAIRDVEWPANASALISLSGGLDDLADDAPDSELLELLRHGLSLFSQRIISEDQYMAEQQAIIREVLAWGDGIQSQLDNFTRSN